MKEKVNFDMNRNEESIDFKRIILKYFQYWPWFVGISVLALVLAYGYLQYAPTTYESIAKIKIIDDAKELNVIPDAMTLLGANSKVNLDNQIEVLKSYRLLNQVVSELNLDVDYYHVGRIKTTQIWKAPFVVLINIPEDSIITPLGYEIDISTSGITITDQKGKKFTSYEHKPITSDRLPFTIEKLKNVSARDFSGNTFKVVINPRKEVVMKLIQDLKVDASNKKSEILTLSLQGESKERSEAILNTTINIFNEDGIVDRQLVSKRTIEVIDKRFIYLSGELDSIEVGKQDFKESNNLSYIEADAGASLQKKSEAESEVFKLETEIYLAEVLKETVAEEAAYGLLPADIGLENSGLNSLVADYNQMALERERLSINVGASHPTLKILSSQLEMGKLNILNTVNNYQTQLKVSLNQLSQEKSRAGSRYSRIPEKEKLLRSIERQQSIKEQLFLLLLQKREEAAINLAITSPSVKVIDYSLTSSKPISPQKVFVYPVSLTLGLLMPFIFLYIQFSTDNKIHDRSELEKLNVFVPVLGEIPFLNENKNFLEAGGHTILVESFRILSTNANYLLRKKENSEGQVIYLTSATKGEGKSLLAFNLSLAYASMKKKVLLVGADLRNPQLHTYFKIDRNTFGLSDFLKDPKINWKDCIQDGFQINGNHKVCLSGSILNDAPVLLSGPVFDRFIENARKEYDYIIVDTAPTLLVTDTLLIAQHADLTIFVVRAGFTTKRVIEFSKELNQNKKLNNMAYVLNGVGFGRELNYNYGYGYGYGVRKKTVPWYNYSKKRKKAVPKKEAS